MRKWLWLATYLLLTALTAYAAWPFVGLYQLGRAVHSANADEALQRIDLRAVRRSLIYQALRNEVHFGRVKLTMDSHAEKLLMEAATAALDARAAEFLTPEVLRRLIAEGEFSLSAIQGGSQTPASPADAAPSGGTSVPRNPLRFLHSWRLSSPVTFKVNLGYDQSPQDRLSLTLRLKGSTWVLTEVLLSESLLKGIRPLIEERMQPA